MKIFVFKIFLLSTGIILGLLLSEIFLRVFWPQYLSPTEFAFDENMGRRPKPNMSGFRSAPGIFVFSYSNNSRGYRGAKEYGPKSFGVKRILALGDSFTYGIGVHDRETWPAQLEEQMRSKNKMVEVINAACPGTSTDYALKLTENDAPSLNPDIIILGFTPNDYAGNASSELYSFDQTGRMNKKTLPQQEPRIGRIRKILGYEVLAQHSHLFNLIKTRIVLAASTRDTDIKITQPVNVPPLDRQKKGVLETQQFIKALSDWANSRQTKLILLFIPSAPEVEKFRRDRSFSLEEKIVEGIAETEGIQFLSGTESLANENEKIEDMYFAEGHCRANAYKKIAELILANYIKSL